MSEKKYKDALEKLQEALAPKNGCEISLTGRCLHTTGNDNAVDACVEMILKLKEENLL